MTGYFSKLFVWGVYWGNFKEIGSAIVSIMIIKELTGRGLILVATNLVFYAVEVFPFSLDE